MKVAVIFHRLGPYHFARLRAAGQKLPVVAMETSGTDETYAWDVVAGADGFERVTLFTNADAQKQPAWEVTRRLATALDKIGPGVVAIPGWADSAALGALRWCVQKQVPAIIMSESTAGDATRSAWREAVKRQVVGLGSAALAGGTPHRDYLVQLGMPAKHIFLGYDAVDNEYFARSANEVRRKNAEGKRENAETFKTENGSRNPEVRNQESEARKKHGLPEKYFLASARFIEKKNLPRLIEAYARYRELAGKLASRKQKAEIWDLVLLGDGDLQSSILHLRSSLGLDTCVHLPGFKQYGELPAYYASAGAFIHASTTEQWGLVVNEAMASGLPVLVSHRCGCARDLVQEGVNGFTFDPHDVEEMAQLMLRISDFRFPISDFGNASRRIIADWGPERFAQGLKAAAECALSAGPVKPTLAQRAILAALLRK